MACVERFVGVKRQVEQQSAEKEIAAELLVDQHGVFTEPAETRPAREIAFEQRRGIDDGAAARAGRFAFDPREQCLQLFAQHVVIIKPSRIASDFAVQR